MEHEKTDFFLRLVEINLGHTDSYYQQTKFQANNSFLFALICSLISFLIIGAGIIMLFSNRTNSAYITLVAGTLSEFISGVFFYLYNRTIIKMAGYHHKLYYTQNISLALRTANEMKGEEQAKAQQMIIEQLTKDINLQIQPAK